MEKNFDRQTEILKELAEIRGTDPKRAEELKKELRDLRDAAIREYWENDRTKFTCPDDIPDLPGCISEEDWKNVFRPRLIRGGAIPKSKLVPGMTYNGSCRNSSKATWNGEEFEYMRCKFGMSYLDSVPHFDDAWNTSMDCFIPISEYVSEN